MEPIVIVTKKTKASKKLIKLLSDKLNFIEINNEDEIESRLHEINPSWVFFTHWSKIVPESIFNTFRCVVMHTSNLPKDRGGSPLQNQIVKGVLFSQINAIEMKSSIDSGKIYCSKEISLQGSLNDIIGMLTVACVDLIIECVENNPTPVNQKGTPTINKRKLDNHLKLNCTLEHVYDQIRMLDGDDYPRTHLDIEGFRFEFSRACLSEESILTDVKIFKIDE